MEPRSVLGGALLLPGVVLLATGHVVVALLLMAAGVFILAARARTTAGRRDAGDGMIYDTNSSWTNSDNRCDDRDVAPVDRCDGTADANGDAAGGSDDCDAAGDSGDGGGGDGGGGGD